MTNYVFCRGDWVAWGEEWNHPRGVFIAVAGTYKDSVDGKTFADTVEILEPAELSLTAMVTDAECNVFSETGIVDVDVSGGTPGYTYLWSDAVQNVDPLYAASASAFLNGSAGLSRTATTGAAASSRPTAERCSGRCAT